MMMVDFFDVCFRASGLSVMDFMSGFFSFRVYYKDVFVFMVGGFLYRDAQRDMTALLQGEFVVECFAFT